VRDCGPSPSWAKRASLLSLPQAKAVQEFLRLGVSVLVSSLGSYWRENPFPCILGPQAPPVVSWVLMHPPSPTSPSLQAFVFGIQSTSQGLTAYQKFLQLWESQRGVQELQAQSPAFFTAVKEIFETTVLDPNPEKGTPPRAPRGRVVQSGASGGERAPILVFSRSGAQLVQQGLWVVDDVFFACKSITCKR